MIYQELNVYEFRDAFNKMGRGDQFSYDALSAIYEYLNDIGEDYGLDVIAICCDFTEYESIEAFTEDYNGDHSSWDEVAQETLVLKLENDGAVVQQY